MLGAPSLLLVEDDLDHGSLLAHWLEAAGIRVSLATTGEEGIRMADEGSYDIIISDVNLPGVSGLEVIRESKRTHPWRPTALITASGGLDLASSAVRLKVDDVFAKPINAEVLVDRVRTLITASLARRTESDFVVLAIGAHPDDVEVGCGGGLLRYKSAGHRIVIHVMTDGSAGGNTGLRRLEAERAADKLGATISFGRAQDTAVTTDRDTIESIACLVRKYEPKVVFTHAEEDTHQDHRATFAATMIAARSVGNVLCYQSPSTTTSFQPNLFLDVEDYLEAKMELVAAHATQTSKAPYLAPELLRSTARYWGRFAGYRAVEPMKVIRFVQ
jgi:LmbE family N-acetylglucosaminyl deacetylase/CheY-like chemotaxis protein